MPALRVTFQGGDVLDLTDPADLPFTTRRDSITSQLLASVWYSRLLPDDPDVIAVAAMQAATQVHELDRAWRALRAVSRIDLLGGRPGR
jgi:hypothetical protein